MTDQPVETRSVEDEQANMRLDSFLVNQFPQFSRAKLQRAVGKQQVTVDGNVAKSSLKLKPGQRVEIVLPVPEPATAIPEDIPLDLLYEDEHLAAVNKPPSMVVHPAKGHWSGTLTAALAFRFEQLSQVGGATRPGIVHRLDRDTSGVILVAKSDLAHHELARQFEQRAVEKEYWAIVSPAPDRDRDLIDRPIGVHPYQREKMAIREGHSTSRDAQTRFEVQERLDGFAVVRLFPKTGRTHQIRVHLAHVGCPVLCDRHYSGRARVTRGDFSGDRNDQHVLLERQALHASRIAFHHPVSGERLTVSAPLREDLVQTLEVIRTYRG
ncbi:MAG: RluA family pseudouridine synthase [Mariniblastus sp.]|nr:RluA family pseudouridine synthase [Mariniblastus sp.]